MLNRPSADRWHELQSACRAVDLIEMPAEPVQEVYARIERLRNDERTELWLGSADGQVVAIGSLALPMLDNLDNASVDVRVHPAARRRGYGRAMLDHLVEAARAVGSP